MSTPWPIVRELGARPGTDAIGERVTALRDQLEAPSVLAAVLHHGVVTDFRAAGVVDLDTLAGPTPDSVVRVGSITKLFTAIAVMQLVERGLIDLEQSANTCLTSFQLSDDRVTVKHLLTHTSGAQVLQPEQLGVPDGEPLPGIADVLGPVYAVTRQPGEVWEYSNGGMAALGQLVADVSGLPYEEYVLRHLLDPVGMTRSDLVRSARTGAGPTPYDSVDGTVSRGPYLDIIVRPAGSLYSTATDLARFADAICNGGLLSAETMSLVLAPHVQIPGGPMHQGLGFLHLEIEGTQVAWHNGGWPGAKSTLWIAPTAQLAVFLTTNSYDDRSPHLDTAGKELITDLLVKQHGR